MNQQIVDYLQKNKERYTQESLVEQLKKSGYNTSEINEGVNFVYNLSNDTNVADKSKFRALGIGCGVITVILIVVATIVVFYMYGVSNNILKSDDTNHREMVDKPFKKNTKINKGVVEHDLDTEKTKKDNVVMSNSDGKDSDIVINNIHFSLKNTETLVTGGVKYTYSPVDKNVNQEFIIVIPKRVMYDSEGTRDFYENMSESADRNVDSDEWDDENNDEFGFYISSYNENMDKTEYELFDVTNGGKFQSILTVAIDGSKELGDMEKIVTIFRQVSMTEADKFKMNNTTSQSTMDSVDDIAFHFDQEDFIFDVTTGFEYTDEHKRYIPINEKRKPRKTKSMLVSKLKKAVYDSANAGCKHLKSGVNTSAKVVDISFGSSEECGFVLSGALNGKYLYEWTKVTKNGMQAYTYRITKDIDDKLPVEVVDKITEEFKEFKY